MPGINISQGESGSVRVGLDSSQPGPQSGAVSLSLESVKGSSNSTRGATPASVGTQSVGVKGVGFRAAEASVGSGDLGRYHVGASGVGGTVSVTNGAVNDGYSEGLGLTSAAAGEGWTLGDLPGGLIGAGGVDGVAVGLGGTVKPGYNTGTLTLGLKTDGAGTSGLGSAALAAKECTVFAFGYTGKAQWNVDADGDWNAFGSWDEAGGKPGVDGVLSVSDTASFGSAAKQARTVSLNGVSPVLTALTFDNAGASYRIAPGTGGGVTLGTSQEAGVVRNVAGKHTIAADVTLAADATVDVAAGAQTVLSGSMSGPYGLVKSGPGTLTLSGAVDCQGATTVKAGKLVINGTLAAGGGTLTVESGAVLGGSGTIGVPVVVSGTHAPGNSPGVESFASGLTFNSGMTFQWELIANTAAQGTEPNYVFDQVSVTGQMTYAGTFNAIFNGSSNGGVSSVRFSDSFWDSAQVWQVFSVSGTSTGNFASFVFGLDVEGQSHSSQGSFSFSPASGQLSWSPTVAHAPEVGNGLAGLLVMAGLLRRSRAGRCRGGTR